MEPSPFDHPYRGGFVGKQHRFALTVFFEDTDTAGIVYYANYLKFMERARSDMLRAAGIDQRAAKEDGTGVYAVAEVNIRYLRPAKLGDDLLVLLFEWGPGPSIADIDADGAVGVTDLLLFLSTWTGG